MSKLFHPDRCADDRLATEKFQALQQVYTILVNAEKRKKYDAYGTVEFDDKPCAITVSDEQLSKCKQNYAGERWYYFD